MMESAEVSGKVFRFLSAMHPALSKAERKRYADYDPDQWYAWTDDLSAEFTDLMRRSPRDTSFARGFAYVYQRSVPEGSYVKTSEMISNIDRLPAAFRAPEGNGFSAEVDRNGHARIAYVGMPGFSNACIAIQGELEERLKASGARGVEVRHAATCRLSGSELCEFDVEWTGEGPPAGASPVEISRILRNEAAATPPASAEEPAVAEVEETEVELPSQALYSPDGSDSRRLLKDIEKKLSEADRQAGLYEDALVEITRLRARLAGVEGKANERVAEVEQHQADTESAYQSLKNKIGKLVKGD